MTTASHIPLPAPLRTSANLAVEWKRFKGQWSNYVKAAKIDREEKDRQAAILLACIGTDAYEIYTTMEFADDADKDDPDKLIDAFEKHCIGEVNEVYERYVFHRRQQEPGESFDTFVGDLRRLVKSCDYGVIEESMIRDRIVLGIRDDATRKKLLQTRKLDLMKAIDICRSAEATTRQLKAITSPDEIQSLRQRPSRSQSRHRREKSRGRSDVARSSDAGLHGKSERRCKYCDKQHEPSKKACGAYGKTCSKCFKKNHYAVVCKSKIKNEACESLTEESLLSLNGAEDKRCYSNIIVDGHKIKFLLDCGSSVNLMPKSILTMIGKSQRDLRPPRSVLKMFDGNKLRTLGMMSAELTHPRTRAVIESDFYITEREEPILGIDVCRRLDMLRIVNENICEVSETSSPSTPTTPTRRITEADVFKRYADLFDGTLGLLEGDVHLETDPSIPPVQMPLRRLPVAMRDRVEKELRQMVDDGVIAPVTRPTPWVSALLVVAKQDGGIRICMDPKFLNKALQRSVYYMPTIDDVLPKLNNAKVFSLVDVKSAFWTLKLDEESSYLTTFETPFGRFRWLRMAYGLSPAPEIFQSRIHEALSGLQGVHCIADDILVSGSGDSLAAAERDHDKNLIALLERCRQKGLKLNKSKLSLNRKETRYMGHLLTSSGLRADDRKVEAVLKMPIPEDKKALQRVLGMATYLARYCPNFSEITAPLRELLHTNNEFRWDVRHTEAYERLKTMLSSAPVLAYYSSNKEVICQCDASQAGLGAVIIQDGKVVEYASRALTKIEQSYAQIEKELLSIVFGLTRFDMYCYGRHVTVENDHKPLLAIHQKSLAAAPKRLQRMLLLLQRYNYKLVFRPSTQMILADTLSRAYSTTHTETALFPQELAMLSTVDRDQMTELKMVASADTIAKITAAAKSDDEYCCLIKQIERGWPDAADAVPACLRPYYTYADELSVSCGIVFKGHRIVVPIPVRQYFIDRLHSAHIGVNGCLRRARETVFWPGITKAIKRVAETCQICAHYQQAVQKEPLLSHPPPSRPWEKVGVDIFTYADQDYLLTVDYLSGYFEIDRLPSKAVTNITYCLRQQFARFGLPIEVCTDNSPFLSAEFQRFAERYEFRHTTSSPRYSQSNGRVEAAIKTAKRLMIKAAEANADPFLALLEWRNCPAEQLSPYSPAQLMFGRRTRTRLPTCDKLLDTPTSQAASKALASAKERQAAYYNRSARERPPFSVGQTVRVRFDERPEWRKAEIADVLPYRSYNVRFEDGTTRRRTSKHVRFSAERPIVIDDDITAQPPAETPLNSAADNKLDTAPPIAETMNDNNSAIRPSPVVVTRSGRSVRRPARYND